MVLVTATMAVVWYNLTWILSGQDQPSTPNTVRHITPTPLLNRSQQVAPSLSQPAASEKDAAGNNVWNVIAMRSTKEREIREQEGSNRTSMSARLLREVESIPQCRALGRKFNRYLAAYIDTNYFSKSGETAASDKSQKTLIYSCESHKKGHFCGGMGDRFRGIISSFYLGLLTKRKFALYHPKPVALQKFLRPNLVNFVPDQEDLRLPAVDHHRSAESVEAMMANIPVDLQLMSIKKHKKYLSYLASASAASKQHIRLQSNSFGIDGFLHHSAKQLDDVKQNEMGLPRTCNVSAYFGCLYHVLFTPSEELHLLEEKVLDGMSAAAVLRELAQGGLKPASLAAMTTTTDVKPATFLLSMQVRIGGSWANQLAIPEPFRTPPATVPHFFSLVREILAQLSNLLDPSSDHSDGKDDEKRGAAGASVKDAAMQHHLTTALFPRSVRWISSGAAHASRSIRPRVILFVSSDAPIFINKTVLEFNTEREGNKKYNFDVVVRCVDGDSFTHTDSGDLAAIRPDKFTQVSQDAKAAQYLLTLLNHRLISRADHVVMAQSGFGDTAFWVSRTSASCIFVDMTNNRLAWQHHLAYDEGNAHHQSAELKKDEGIGCCSARATRNRILDVSTEPTLFYRKDD